MDSLINKKVQACNDLFVVKEDKSQGPKVISEGKAYKVLAISEKPQPFCFVVENDLGRFDMIHISNFKMAKASTKK